MFCALFQGAEMGRKVEKVAKNFSANIFNFNADTVDADIRQVQNDLDDRTRTMRMTRDHIQGRLGDLASNCRCGMRKRNRTGDLSHSQSLCTAR